MKKETAVEWLFSELERMQYFIGNDMLEAFEKAKAMEKEQIIDAYLDGADACDLEVKGDRVLLVKPDTNLLGQEYFYQNY